MSAREEAAARVRAFLAAARDGVHELDRADIIRAAPGPTYLTVGDLLDLLEVDLGRLWLVFTSGVTTGAATYAVNHGDTPPAVAQGTAVRIAPTPRRRPARPRAAPRAARPPLPDRRRPPHLPPRDRLPPPPDRPDRLKGPTR